MTATITKPRVGVVDPQLLYTTSALMDECKLGRDLVTRMRQVGGVEPVQIGNQLYYDGAQVKAWILKQPRKQK